MSEDSEFRSLSEFDVIKVEKNKQEGAGAGANTSETLQNSGAPASRPCLTDGDVWVEYVMRQFKEDELYEGNPTADGLRRVAELVLGPIIRSVPKLVFPPSFENGFHATVSWEIDFLFSPDAVIGNSSIRTFGDVADVYAGNTDEEYALYAAATAGTRAEARALRKALRLKRVVAAEEVKNQVDEEDVQEQPGKIKSTTIAALDRLGQRNNINMFKFINLNPKKQYDSVKQIDQEDAVKMIKYLSSLQQDQSKISLELKGYDKDWRKN